MGRKDRITNMVPDVDLGNLDAERSVSRRHAEFAYEHGTTILRDLGSTNGSSVNGERLAVQVDRPLQDGDTIAFGAVTMTFKADAEWPEGVEALWPPEVAEPSPEETMIAGGPEETMVASPYASEETMVAPPASFDAGETAVFAPTGVADAPRRCPRSRRPPPTAAPARAGLRRRAGGGLCGLHQPPPHAGRGPVPGLSRPVLRGLPARARGRPDGLQPLCRDQLPPVRGGRSRLRVG